MFLALHTVVIVTIVLLNEFSGGFSGVDAHIRLVQIVHRHGDRNPISFYPNDPHKVDDWPDGLGELQIAGKRRMYEFGKALRQRYATFLGSNPREVKAKSSAADRCLESSASLLAGLYPPTGRWVFDTSVPQWQPVAIYSIPHPEDYLLYPDSYCPKAFEDVERVKKSREYADYVASVENVLDYVKKNSGFRGKMTIDEAEHIFDAIYIGLSCYDFT